MEIFSQNFMLAKKLIIILLAVVFAFPSSNANAAGTLKTYTAVVAGKGRTYLVYQPTACAAKACPVLFMFHGLNGTADQVAKNYGWQETADKNNFVAVFPESLTIPQKDVKIGNWVVYSNYDAAGKHWDIANISLPISQRYTTQDVEFVKTILTDLPKNYKILPTHVYATGHSYGAFFSYYVSMCLPDKITAFASHSGGYTSYSMYSFPIPARDAKSNAAYLMPGMILHSPKDTKIQYQWSLNLANEMKAKSQPYQFIQLADAIAHNWDMTKNQTQWDFFKKNSPVLP